VEQKRRQLQQMKTEEQETQLETAVLGMIMADHNDKK
jgi:hypothetical protein